MEKEMIDANNHQESKGKLCTDFCQHTKTIAQVLLDRFKTYCETLCMPLSNKGFTVSCVWAVDVLHTIHHVNNQES